MKYKVTCENCNGSDILMINDQNQVAYTEHQPIIAARLRPDNKWGFECTCGQDSRLAPQEKGHIDILVQGASKAALKAIKKSLTPKNELKFRLEQM